ISPPPVVDKTASVTPSVPEVAASSTSDAGLPAAIPDASPAPAAGQKILISLTPLRSGNKNGLIILPEYFCRCIFLRQGL
ncbi:hypothetical protein V7O37_09735, partial [Escherichia coli]